MKSNLIDTDREKDIQALCEGVVNCSPSSWDNPNGGYEHTCPFCYEITYSRPFESVSMNDIIHKQDCAYLIAKDLKTGL